MIDAKSEHYMHINYKSSQRILHRFVSRRGLIARDEEKDGARDSTLCHLLQFGAKYAVDYRVGQEMACIQTEEAKEEDLLKLLMWMHLPRARKNGEGSVSFYLLLGSREVCHYTVRELLTLIDV